MTDSAEKDALVSERLHEISDWIDAGNAHRDAEAITWGRLAKIGEEFGEVIEAYIGATGQNPRKGMTHDMGHVSKELLDVALTALCAAAHLGVDDVMEFFAQHVAFVHDRAGLTRIIPPGRSDGGDQD